MIKKLLGCLLFMCGISLLQAQTQIYVSPTGRDGDKGSLQAPFRTLEKAVTLAGQQAGQTVTIFLRGGTYYLDTTLIISSASNKAKAINIQPYKKEQPIISAGRKLQLKWQPYQSGILKARVPKDVSFERLYANGALQVLARYPNYNQTAKYFNGTAEDAIAPERVKKWSHPIGGYVHALHAFEWGGYHYRIIGVKPNGSLELDGGWQNNRPGAMHPKERFIENIFEELDTAGEWFLDRQAGLLYFYPPQGMDITKTLFEAARFKNSIELRGTSENPVRNIHIRDIQFAHNERSFWDTKEPLVRSDWTVYRGGTLVFDGTENCMISNCNFNQVGGNAIMVSNYNKADTITGCHIRDIGASAVAFIGDPAALRSPSFRYEDYIPYASMDRIPGPKSQNFPQQCVVQNNLIHDVGRIEKQATGVQIEMASEITVRHNSIYNTPRAGINIGDGAFGGHLLEFNDVFNTVLETGDHGAFNSWGRDRFWAPNRNYMDSLVALHPELILLDAQKQTIIRNNRFRCDHGWDIDLDDGSSNYHIYNNVCLSGGLKLREGFFRIVENNIMVNNSFHPHVWFKNSGDVFSKNIVMKKYAPIRVPDWGQRVDSNLFPDAAALSEAQKNGTDLHSLYGDPQFKNAAKGDYTVLPGSPALKLGFKNFPMDQFGVMLPNLKKLAAQPKIPKLITSSQFNTPGATYPLLGGEVRSVMGLGDRSAFGLADEKGVVIVAIGSGNSLLKQSGLQKDDVIKMVNGSPIAGVKELLEALDANKFSATIPAQVIRFQQPITIALKTR